MEGVGEPLGSAAAASAPAVASFSVVVVVVVVSEDPTSGFPEAVVAVDVDCCCFSAAVLAEVAAARADRDKDELARCEDDGLLALLAFGTDNGRALAAAGETVALSALA